MFHHGITFIRRLLAERGIRVVRTEFPDDHPTDLLTILLDREEAIGPGFRVVQIGGNDGVSGDPIHEHVTSREWILLAVERRVRERRPKQYSLMTQPRSALRKVLLARG